MSQPSQPPTPTSPIFPVTLSDGQPQAADADHDGTLFDTYSPSRPEYVLDSTFWDYVDLGSVQGGRPCQSVFSNNVQAAGSGVLDVCQHFSQPGTPRSAEFVHSPGFLGWYQSELQAGNLDNVLLSDNFCASPVRAPSPGPSAAPLSQQDIATLLRLLQDTYDTGVVSSSSDHSAGTVNPVAVYGKCRYDNGDDQPHDAAAVPIALPPSVIQLDNTDIHNTSYSVSSSDEMPLAADVDSSDEEDDGELCVDDIKRYYWVRGDVKFLIVRDGTSAYLTVEDLEERYSGVKKAIWTFWKLKKRGKVNTKKVLAHLRFKGHAGFYSQAMWHLAPKAVERKLLLARKKGILHKMRL